MNRYTYTLTLISLLTPITSNGESMIGNLLKKLKKPSEDLSLTHPGIKKVGSGLFVYKLARGNSTHKENNNPSAGIPYDHAAIAALKREQADKQISKAVSDERQALYGSDKSPIKNAAVMAAWDKADEAERRLQDHREYMNKVRSNRKNISSKKSSTK